MGGGEKFKGPFSFKTAKKVLSQSDLERLACAFLATENVHQFDHTKAAAEFGGAKPDSFKRQIWVITKKIREAMDMEEGEEDVMPEVKAKGKAKSGGVGGRKRKAAPEHGGSDEGHNGGGVAAKKKKMMTKAPEFAVKTEGRFEDGEGSEEDWLV